MSALTTDVNFAGANRGLQSQEEGDWCGSD